MSNNDLHAFLREINKSFIGYYNVLSNDLPKQNSYPPMDYVKKSDTEVELRLAVAGFSKEDIEVEYDPRNSELTISGCKPKKSEEVFLHKGIAERQFKNTFQVNPKFEISNVSLKDGILSINLKLNIPEQDKPKLLQISDG